MTKKQTAPLGSWKSPITSDLIVSETIGLGAITLDGDDIYWLEGRPAEKGRNVLVKYSNQGGITEVNPASFNVRTRVHEYGGGAFLVVDGTVFFSNFTDQCIYKQAHNSQPKLLAKEAKKCYADFIFYQQRNRLICVCEDHSNSDQEAENTLVSIDLNSGEVQNLVSGNNFYSSPRLSPDNSQISWLSWNHPNMPWDSTQLWIADINNDGSISNSNCIAGGKEESICQPEWSPDGSLYFSSDRTGWWNFYRYLTDGTIESVYEMEAEFGYPHWVFGISTYGFDSESRLICTYSQNGRWYLASLDTKTKQLQVIDSPYTSISSLQVKAGQAVFIGGSPTQATSVVKLDLNSGKTDILRRASELKLDSGYLSIPEAIAFPTENNLTAYGWFYPPTNKDYNVPQNSLPPLLVKSHGGPTASASATLNLRIQYWTSRGFAYVDVNYGGSTGYGREYRQRLDKQWGIVDVDDCVNAAKYLAEQGKVDGEKLAIAGSSAGGYTTLAALTFRDVFKAGASYYGVSDLEVLAKDTHKFESRYLDRLIGSYPEEKEIYIERSPIHFIERLSCPIIFFQGLEDKVVPPNQAEMMFEALKAKGLPVAYVPFPEEQHGFRSAANIKRALDEELGFYSRIFGFEK